MFWFAIVFWLTAAVTLLNWRARWRLAGGVTPRRFLGECRLVLGNMQGLMFLSGVFALLTLPFAAAFDMMPPALIPLQIPLASIAILGTTGPVSFLVLGPSRWHTTDICAALLFRFPRLRAGAALNPLSLGALADHALGPSGNLWMSKGSEPWRRKVVRMIENAPLIVFDARTMTSPTRWELSYLLLSAELPKLIIVGPVEDPGFSDFLCRFGGVPIVTASVLTKVVKAASGSRVALEEWYDRRRHAIVMALHTYKARPRYAGSPSTIEAWLVEKRFAESLPELVALHSTTAAGVGSAGV